MTLLRLLSLLVALALCACDGDGEVAIPGEEPPSTPVAEPAAEAPAVEVASAPLQAEPAAEVVDADGEPPSEAPLPTDPGCYWLFPEQGVERVTGTAGFDLKIAVVAPPSGAVLKRVEVFAHPGENVREGAGEKLAVLPLLGKTAPGCSEACVATGRFAGGLGPGTYTLVARVLNEGNDKTCESNNTVQINAAPQVKGLRVDPAEPDAGVDIRFDVEFFDPDGDDLVIFHVWRNAAGREVHERVLAGRETRPGERWTFEFTAQDPFERTGPLKVEFKTKIPEGHAEKFCSPGTTMRGLGPPWDHETWCEKEGPGGKMVRHGFHRRWWSAAKELIKSEEEWRDGRKHGRWTSWHENDKKAYEATWKDGKLWGPARAWHDNGSESAEYSFRDGEKHGVEINWYGSGEEQYRMDAFELGRKQGVETRRHRNGNKKEETHWRDGQRHGVQTRWYLDGSKHEERTYMVGKRQGTWTRWYPNGVKAAEGQYEDGRPSGQWQRWNENGDLEDAGSPATP